jgi:hypothetical protein
MTLKPGWLNRQFARVEEEVRQWPEWMRREAGFEERRNEVNDQQLKCLMAAILYPYVRTSDSAVEIAFDLCERVDQEGEDRAMDEFRKDHPVPGGEPFDDE